ncbi:MAG: transposase [Bacillota bacterium]|nr:transposase [Bacillota bacterium]
MRRKFDKDFKQESVKLVLEQKRPVSAVAREIGVHANTLHKWIAQYQDHQENAFPGSGNLRPEDEETRRLHKRIADLEEENKILKKATAIFAKHQK